MRDQDSEAWLRLMLVHGMGPAYAVRLLSAFGTPAQALDASLAALGKYIPTKLAKALKQGPVPALLESSLQWLGIPENRLLTLSDPEYPPRLLQIADPPPLLYLKGNTALLSRSSVAVVGSRNATPQGVQNAEAFSRELSLRGWCIASGLALGIDAAAHRGGLMGPGSTIAVVGTGLDIVYPARNHALAHEIARTGVIISEFPLGTPAKPGHFPRRNRIISGLARGVLVVEAALQSGSLITAREAAEQGREVFAIPGSIHSPVAKGCHLLIKQGAKLVETAADILDELDSESYPILPLSLCTNEEGSTDPKAAALLEVLGYDPVDIDTLTHRAGLTPEQSYAILLTLELDGKVAKLPGGRYQRLV
ncbi:DNA-processing protein DprA [Chitinimonas sp. BJB300]|uniref:DNA-processing protein DprA n=1 Tax=Chitinimonas sp. BJB300 TaxID=1559339 RepID=UPI000C1098A8|nr:DNA-processing protein DprA [Chitinimonas sp. BJB300]PHV11133.1 DNA-protecting protein DprA [Chitinimonas sp. BJB300]TSJ90979.1 DNA-protecting protein DprA [Chitinimonas sp. BJB300]